MEASQPALTAMFCEGMDARQRTGPLWPRSVVSGSTSAGLLQKGKQENNNN